jgi:hypothetical protein
MIDIPQAGGQSVLIGFLLFILRVLDRMTQPDRRKIQPEKTEREDLKVRLDELTSEIERLGRNKADRYVVSHMERRISDVELTISDIQRRRGD